MRPMLLLLGAFFAAATARAQDKIELFAGYTHFHLDSLPAGELNGWELSGEYKLARWVGGVADFSGDYGSVTNESNPAHPFPASTSVHNFLFGPQVSLPTRISPFAHVLGGATHFAGNNQDYTSAAVAVGGGVDVKVASVFSIRLIQADYVHTYFFGAIQNYRISTGIVFRF
jgi:hypothetical protein